MQQILSTVEDIQYCGRYHQCYGCIPLVLWGITSVLWRDTVCLIFSCLFPESHAKQRITAWSNLSRIENHTSACSWSLHGQKEDQSFSGDYFKSNQACISLENLFLCETLYATQLFSFKCQDGNCRICKTFVHGLELSGISNMFFSGLVSFC